MADDFVTFKINYWLNLANSDKSEGKIPPLRKIGVAHTQINDSYGSINIWHGSKTLPLCIKVLVTVIYVIDSVTLTLTSKLVCKLHVIQ